jgi:hypothetical protein
MRALLLGAGFAALMAAQASACGIHRNITVIPAAPPPGAEIDRFLPEAKMSKAKREQVKALRAQVAELAAAHKDDEARKVEQQAMHIMGVYVVRPNCSLMPLLRAQPKPAPTS